MYHYTDGGLKNVWLVNGYTLREMPYGEGIAINDLDGLGAAFPATIWDLTICAVV